MYLRRSAAVKYLIAAYVGAALYSEWLVYVMQPLFWPELKCEDEGNGSCLKVLFIADPQLQGELAAPPPWNHIFIWDSDRFVKSTFSVVLGHFKPDVLVYLGDLTDEGSIASIEQFHRYAKRLFHIFEIDYPVIQVWLPGDNDIGGEFEPIKRDKVSEFDLIFNQPPVISTHSNVTFYKVNGITHSYPKRNSKDDYRIVVSHYPVTLRQVFGHQVDNEIHPQVYFCAHEHQSKYVIMEHNLSHRETHILSNEVLTIPQNGDKLFEVYVPTCSYRMGTGHIGFGAAVIEKPSYNLKYTVFWSPRRFPYLFTYLALLIMTMCYCLVYCVAKLLLCHRKPTTWSTDKATHKDEQADPSVHQAESKLFRFSQVSRKAPEVHS